MKKELVISAYERDYSWINEINPEVKITVYRKGCNELKDGEIHVEPNLGRDVHTFFYHLIKRYDSLSDITFFSQDYFLDHVSNYIEIINGDKITWDNNAKQFNNGCWFFSTTYDVLESDKKGCPNHCGLNLDKMWEKLFNEDCPEILKFTPAGHFAITKEQVRSIPLIYYQKILNILESEPTSPWEIERLEPYIFLSNFTKKMTDVDDEKYNVDNIKQIHVYEEFNDHIFVIDAWPDNESKEKDLLSLIRKLKTFNIEILLCTHYPIKEQIQKMVDFFIYDKKNPILLSEEFESHSVSSGRWTTNEEYTVNNSYEFHHDYAIWETMRNAFNFAKYLNKKYIHFLEYDNIPDDYQYRQSFVEKIKYHDVILYEYTENSIIDHHLNPFCATYIFSIKTDIALKTINQINSKFEYFNNRPKGWQLEKIFLDCVKKVTNNIKITDYIANNNELNTQAVWNRDGMNMNGAIFQAYPCVDIDGLLYLHLISGFHEKDATQDYLLEVEYKEIKKFILLKKKEFLLEKLGLYEKGNHIKIYYQGVMVYNEFLGKSYENFYKLNNVEFKNQEPTKPIEINFNFVDGPFVEVKSDGNKTYKIEILDKNNEIYYLTDIKPNMWVKGNRKYYEDWTINLYDKNNLIFSHKFDPKDKKIYIHLDSSSLGDTIAWFPYVEEFRKKHNCKVVCSTFWNHFFEKTYPEIEFIKPGTLVNGLYAMYQIGCFYDKDKEPVRFNTLPLQQVASNILGLEYDEVKPKINFLPNKNNRKKKYVTIGYHSTAGLKYWNNPKGWQEVVDYLISQGYDVLSLSLDPCGIKGVIELEDKSMNNIMNLLYHSEFFIGISSGLSWLSWALNKHVVMISNITNEEHEFETNITRIVNKNVCNSCWHDPNVTFDKGDWNWCPFHKGTERHFECTKSITSEMVIEKIKPIIYKYVDYVKL